MEILSSIVTLASMVRTYSPTLDIFLGSGNLRFSQPS
ncbi:hypothetical protein M6B38_228465 [Iris pallida]|uniref:Uncharacterized protein n=1 Tax=Iris pallida TaxID=29817 RepID=A0AAX6DSY1_IRIPA|nr:hypothetical protein M6B38_228465 [Iris pallida]